MQVGVEPSANRLVIVPSGRLDGATASMFEQRCNTEIEKKQSKRASGSFGTGVCQQRRITGHFNHRKVPQVAGAQPSRFVQFRRMSWKCSE